MERKEEEYLAAPSLSLYGILRVCAMRERLRGCSHCECVCVVFPKAKKCCIVIKNCVTCRRLVCATALLLLLLLLRCVLFRCWVILGRQRRSQPALGKQTVQAFKIYLSPPSPRTAWKFLFFILLHDINNSFPFHAFRISQKERIHSIDIDLRFSSYIITPYPLYLWNEVKL